LELTSNSKAFNTKDKKSLELLCYKLEDNSLKLVDLALENCSISQHWVKTLCDSLKGNQQLKYLNLSKNNLNDECSEYISDMLHFNESLNVLFLHWNKIRSRGAILLAKALETNKYI